MALSKFSMTHLSIRIPKEDHEYLETMAREGGRNLTQEARRAIKAHIAKHQQMRSLGRQRGPNPP